MSKAAKKSGRKSGRKVPGGFTGADDPRRGRGPKKGAPNAGRPPDKHREECQRMISDPKCEKAVRSILGNPKHPAFAPMWRIVAERGYGKTPQPITGADGAPLIPSQINIRLVAARGNRGA